MCSAATGSGTSASSTRRTLAGPELTGTSLFTYGMAWGVRTGVSCRRRHTRRSSIARLDGDGRRSVHANGFLGWVQGTGKQPSDGQPVTFDSVPELRGLRPRLLPAGRQRIARLASP